MRLAGSNKSGMKMGKDGLHVEVEDTDEFLLEPACSPLALRKQAVMGQCYQALATVSSELFQISINRIWLCL